jgi:transketolase
VKSIINSAKEIGFIVTVEEHSIYGGLGAAVAEVVVQNHPVKVKVIGIPDEPAIAGVTSEVFEYYGITADKIASYIKTNKQV